MARFMGLRLHPDGRLDAHLEYGTVQLQPTLADLERRPGWYTFEWKPVPDPTAAGKVNGHAHDGALPSRNRKGQFQKKDASDVL